jgi:hypothetical protein
MPIAGEIEGPGHRGAIDHRRRRGRVAVALGPALGCRVELLDDREKVGEELLVL